MKVFASMLLAALCASGAALAESSGAIAPQATIYRNYDVYTPIFMAPGHKVAATQKPAFAQKLIGQLVAAEPLYATAGTNVHMLYWSGPGNRGSALRLIETINAIGACNAEAKERNCAFWDEGVPSLYFWLPEYFEMNVEHWYDRSYAYGQPLVKIWARTYRNVNPVDYATANLIWGQYSQRYAETARSLKAATGKKIDAWAFVKGAKADRIFYKYEYPVLQQLEREQVVKVHCAKKPDADWRNPDDWSAGTNSAACPNPALLSLQDQKSYEKINVWNRK